MIYVIGPAGSSVVKIGRAGNPAERVAGLQTGNPTPLLLLWSHEGGRELESHLHATFFEYRIRGEWFDLAPLGDPVAAVQEAVRAAPQRQHLLVAPRFNDRPAWAGDAPQADPERPPRPASRPRASNLIPRPGCIRLWERACHRPPDTICGC